MNEIKNKFEKELLKKINKSFKERFSSDDILPFSKLNDVRVVYRATEYSPLMWVLENSKDADLNKNELNYLIKNSDLSATFGEGHDTALTSAIKYARWLELGTKQYQYLIDNCKQEKVQSRMCDLARALGEKVYLNFDENCWVSLIKKTNPYYFNKHYLTSNINLVINILYLLPKILNKEIEEIILDKLNFTEIRRNGLGNKILYKAIENDLWDFH